MVASLDPLGVRQQLPAHPRARTIRADQRIARCSRSVVETRRDRAGGSLIGTQNSTLVCASQMWPESRLRSIKCVHKGDRFFPPIAFTKLFFRTIDAVPPLKAAFLSR